MPENLQAILLAGGKSLRFNTGKTKFIEKICGKEMILYPVHLIQRMNIPMTLVLGFQSQSITQILSKHNINNISIVKQEELLGTGHAVAITKHTWNKDHILIVNGDIPLMTADVIQKLYNKHINTDADISFVTSHSTDQADNSYGKIVFHDNKINVIENKDDAIDIETQCCISVGIYIIKRTFLEKHIDQLTKSAFTGEYYLSELIQIASNENCKIITTPVAFDLARGVNTLAELWAVEHIKRSQIISYWMNHGVRFASTLNVIIDFDVMLEPGVFIGAGAHLIGKSIIKKNVTIGAFSYIKHSTIEEDTKIKSHTVIIQSTIAAHSTIDSFTKIYNQKIVQSTEKQVKTSPSLFTGAIKDKSDTHQSEHR